MRQWGFRRPCLGVCADAALPAPFPGKPLSIPLADGRPLRRRRQRPGQRQPTAWRPTVATEHQQQVLTHNEGPFRDRHPQILVRILAEDAYKFKREQRVRGQHTVGARSFAFHPPSILKAGSASSGPPRRDGALPNSRSNVLSGTQRIRRSIAGAHDGDAAAADDDDDDQDSVDDE
jgi:hypothetical protein